MRTSTRTAVLFATTSAIASLALAGCKDKEEAGTTGAAAETVATAAETATAAPMMASATATPDPAPDAGAVPSPTPTTATPSTDTAPVAAPSTGGGSIEACCNALSAVKTSGKGGVAKDKSARAATMCRSIAPLVKAGTTSRSAALTQIKSALQGVSAPPECN